MNPPTWLHHLVRAVAGAATPPNTLIRASEASGGIQIVVSPTSYMVPKYDTHTILSFFDVGAKLQDSEKETVISGFFIGTRVTLTLRYTPNKNRKPPIGRKSAAPIVLN